MRALKTRALSCLITAALLLTLLPGAVSAAGKTIYTNMSYKGVSDGSISKPYASFEDALKNAANKRLQVIDLLDVLKDTVKTEETVPGMQAEDAHEEEGHDHAEAEYDEHVWLSLKNAQTLCVTIADALCAIDPDNKNTYIANAAAYRDKLAALDADYKAAVDGTAHKTVLFGDRFPFRYLVDDYGLSYYAVFAGCSAETEASFETVSFLAKKVDELGLPCVLTIEGAQHRIAETIVQNTVGKNQKVLTMDSMQSTTSKDVANGVTYLSVMEKNLSVLKEAVRIYTRLLGADHERTRTAADDLVCLKQRIEGNGMKAQKGATGDGRA